MHRPIDLASERFHLESRREEIIQQLERILASPFFKHSERCKNFLEYVVGETLAGKGQELDERQIAIQVFGRKPAYDPNEDSIVRTTAVDVRKRLAQYYFEPVRGEEIRIEIQPGSYVPLFHFPDRVPVPTRASAADLEMAPSHDNHVTTDISAVNAAAKPERRLSRSLILTVAVVVGTAAIIVAALGGIRPFLSSDPVDAFWGPILAKGDTVILATGKIAETVWSSAEGSSVKRLSMRESIAADRIQFVDAVCLTRIAGLISSKGKKFDLLRAGSLTLSEIRKNPTILVSLDNPWARHVMDTLRFRFQLDEGSDTIVIRDQGNPSQVVWRSLHSDSPPPSIQSDRAIISRVLDPETSQVILILAGVGKGASIAVAEFATGSKYLAALLDRAPKGWKKNNLQVVIGTDVVNDNCGPPYIVATHFW
jgi:hypothetical protein